MISQMRYDELRQNKGQDGMEFMLGVTCEIAS